MRQYSSLFFIFSLFMISPLSQADGLSDLHNALMSLNSNNTINATLVTTNYYQQGEGKDKVVRTGKAEITLNDSAQGLQITYNKDMLTQLEYEASERIKNENAKTPTLNVIDNNKATEMKSILSAAPDITRTIAQAKFLNEEKVTIEGKILRQLNFELPVSAIIRDKRTRKYVKNFHSNYSVIITDNGIPLSTQLSFTGKGRAYLVLSVKAEGFEHSTYQVVNQRLVKISSDGGSKFDSTFGYTERKNNEFFTLTHIQNEPLLAHKK